MRAKMTKVMAAINKHRFYLFLVILCCSLYSFFVLNRAFVEVVVESPQKSTFELYWANESGEYSPYRRVETHIVEGTKKYKFYLTNLHRIEKLRVDTHNFEGLMTIKKLRLSQPGYGEIVFDSEEDWKELIPVNQIDNISFGSHGMTVKSTGNDPMFEYKVPAYPYLHSYATYVFSFLVIGAAIFLILTTLGHLNRELLFVPILLTGVLFLVCVIAFTSQDGYHPDEAAHATAVAYYKDHWKPPVVEDPAIRHTFSVYGSSRLNNGEIYYFIAGKFAQCIEYFPLNGYLPYRLFNVFLLSLIVLRTFWVPQTRLLAIPLLLSPQIWYAFSYCTSDALALFIAFSAGCQVFVTDSLFNRYLLQRFTYKKIFNIIVVAICFTLMLYLKKTFYPFVAAIGVSILVSWYIKRDELEWGIFFKKMVVLCLVVCCFAAIPKAVDISVNGLNKAERIVALQEEIAEPAYNMSSPLEVRSPLFTIKERGQSLDTLLFGHRWFEKTFRTSFGVYGHTTIMGPEGYYDAVRWCGIAFFLYFIGVIAFRTPWINRLEALSLLGLGVLLIAASIHHSWTLEIQAQGRYLFPIFSIFGLLYARNYSRYNAKLFTTFVSAMFLLSAYSFITQAIERIPG